MMGFALKKRLIGILFSLLILTIGLFIFTLYQSRLSALTDIHTLLKLVIVQDGESRFREMRIRYSSGYKQLSDSSTVSVQSENKMEKIDKYKNLKYLSEEEKELRAKQTYLLRKNPIKISVLNSLFTLALIENGITLKTALIYSTKSNSTYSCIDSTFYLKSVALSPVTTGIKDEIILQAYVDIPFIYVANKDKTYLIILIGVFCLVLILLLIIWRSKKLEKIIFEPVQKKTRTKTKIKENLYFDKERGILYFNDNVEVSFGNYKLKLFILLLDSPEHFRSAEDIREKIWGKIATKDKLNTTIRRLRKDLEPIPDLKIIFENGGYRLSIR